mmetsp:Transcript_19255/g.27856  ORF Transcript_19255/g.27856 Transcript_19255/m.27856 type:complete len:533 (-) Transcript_19255:383-1981(-)
MEDDDARHRREEAERRARRKAASRSKSESQLEKDRKRKEHAKRVLEQQNKKRAAEKSSRKSPTKETDDAGGSSVFQSMFTRRAEGFLIDLNFRNAPPRPPVGPCFVGLGLDGELTDNWTRYRPSNAVEANYTWKLHTEPDLGVPLAPSAMDLEGCYADPLSAKKKKTGYEDEEEETVEKKAGPPKLHPDDAALINWTGSLGDTAAEQLQKRRERARAAARLQGIHGKNQPTATPGAIAPSNIRRARNNHTSRVLDEKAQFWMKKTTYLTNDASRSVHKFTSLAQTKRKNAQEVETKLKQSRNDADSIARGFDIMHSIATMKHPTKKNVTPVFDAEFLPDATTWGHTFTHVVLDAPPKKVPGTYEVVPSMAQLEHAYVADVQKAKQQAGMVANILVPEDIKSCQSADPTLYEVAQQYDLDVFPLKDEYTPHVNFVLMVDESKGVVTYHPVQSRVQLSMGRPPSNEAGAVIEKRALEESDVKEMEMRVAEVDLDLAKKYGLQDEEEEGRSSRFPAAAAGSGSSSEDSDNEDAGF